MEWHDRQNRHDRFASYNRLFYVWLRPAFTPQAGTFMLPLTFGISAAPPLATSVAMEMGTILGITIAAAVCSAIPLVTGMKRGNVTLGIVGSLFTLPATAFVGIVGAELTLPAAAILFGCVGGLPVAGAFSVIISIVPPPNRPLLSQAEIEEEMRRLRGY